MTDAEYSDDGDPIDRDLPGAPISPGNTLGEMTVLHIYRKDPLKPDSEWALLGFYCHPNPKAVDEKELEMNADTLFNWHVDRIRYVRAEQRICQPKSSCDLSPMRFELLGVKSLSPLEPESVPE